MISASASQLKRHLSFSTVSWVFLVPADLWGRHQDFGTCFPTTFLMRAEHPNPLWTAFKTAPSLSFLGHKGGYSSAQGHEDLSRVGQRRGRGTNQTWGFPELPTLMDGPSATSSPSSPSQGSPAPAGIRNTHAGSQLLVGKTNPHTSPQKPPPSPESRFYPLEMHPTHHGSYWGHPSNPTPPVYIEF